MDSTDLSLSQYRDFSEIINDRLGIKMPESKQVMLQSRIQRRARHLQLSGPSEYHRRFFSDPVFQAGEMEHLFNLATTNKTEFLREADHFRFLVEEALREHLERAGRGEFRIWCAGCSTGEEPYTLSMVLLEERKTRPFEFSITATDVSTHALRTAIAGEYDQERLSAVPEAWRRSYFGPSRQGKHAAYSVNGDVRRRITFGHLNFLAERYGVPGPFDVIFFRNVMIYFDRETQRSVVAKMLPLLRVGGHLMTAHAETLHGLGLPVRQRRTAVYQKLSREEERALALGKETLAC